MKQIKISTEFIKLGQLLKLLDYISTGGEEKMFIALNSIYVNNEKEDRRGRKIRSGDLVRINKDEYEVI